jgi:putative oxidoreductase
MILRRLGRALLALAAINSGLEALRQPDARSQAVSRFGVTDPDSVARADAGVQIGAGVLLLLNRFPRIAALLAALGTVPAAAAALPDGAGALRADEAGRARLLAQLGLLGGLLVAAVDRHGRRRRTKTAAITHG